MSASESRIGIPRRGGRDTASRDTGVTLPRARSSCNPSPNLLWRYIAHFSGWPPHAQGRDLPVAVSDRRHISAPASPGSTPRHRDARCHTTCLPWLARRTFAGGEAHDRTPTRRDEGGCGPLSRRARSHRARPPALGDRGLRGPRGCLRWRSPHLRGTRTARPRHRPLPLTRDEPPEGTESRLLWEMGRAVCRYFDRLFEARILCPFNDSAADDAERPVE